MAGTVLDLQRIQSIVPNELLAKLTYPTSERQWVMYEALRKGATVEQLSQLTKSGRCLSK
jgi:carbamoyl-phosphate synthase large subunit